MGRPKKIKEDTTEIKLSKREMYMGNPNLPTAEAKFEYTAEMARHIERSASNMLYFAMNFFYIITDKGKTQIELYPFQKRILRGIRDNRFDILLSPRQVGKTTLMTIAALHEACFNEYKNIVIVANKEKTAMMILKRIRLAFEELPVWIKPAVENWGKTEISFKNGSTISISTTTGSAVRGEAVNMLIIDEMAFIECVEKTTMITVRNKKTGEVTNLPIGEANKLLSKNTK